MQFLVSFNEDYKVISKSNLKRDELLSFVGKSPIHFRKSIFWARDLKKGDTVTIQDFVFLKPRIGIDAMYFEEFLGKRIASSVVAGEPVSQTDFKDSK